MDTRITVNEAKTEELKKTSTDLSAIKKTAKDYETVEAFYAKYPKTGVMLRINRSVR